MNYFEEFIQRLEEAGINRFMDFDVNDYVEKHMTEHNPDEVYWEIEVRQVGEMKDTHDKKKFRMITFAIQGLIYHFKNRGWIVDDNYLFVRQSNHIVQFKKPD